MFNLLNSASDDQTAIGACIMTLIGASIFVMASFHLGPAGQKRRSSEQLKTNLNAQPQIHIESAKAQDRAA